MHQYTEFVQKNIFYILNQKDLLQYKKLNSRNTHLFGGFWDLSKRVGTTGNLAVGISQNPDGAL